MLWVNHRKCIYKGACKILAKSKTGNIQETLNTFKQILFLSKIRHKERHNKHILRLHKEASSPSGWRPNPKHTQTSRTVIPSRVSPTHFHNIQIDGNAFLKRTQRKAKLNKMKSETDQKGSQMRVNIGPTCARGCLENFEETDRE